MTHQDERMAPGSSPALARLLTAESALPILMCVGVLAWVLLRPLPVKSDAAPGALWVLTAIMLVTALLMRRLRVRFGLDAHSALSLPDPLYPLYLATVILVGPWPAVPLAVIVSLLVTLPESHVGQPDWTAALRQSATAGISTLAASILYPSIWHLLSPPMPYIRAQLVAVVAASLALLAGAALLRALERRPDEPPRLLTWQTVLANPAIRLQALMLALGPLLPLVDVLDDIEAELAWILFLIPLYAIYYLALISIRLEQRKAELQQTVAELRVSRRREAELTGYAALVTRAQEEERRRLARELHDDTAQALVALSRGLDALSSRTCGSAPNEQDNRFIQDLGELAKRSLESIRRACQDLRPSVLDDLGLSAALESLANATTQRGLPCEFHQHGERLPCPPEVETTAYRIAQEALFNASRHACASQAAIELYYLPRALRLGVRDDGRGFDYAASVSSASHAKTAPEVRTGLGLLGMRERASLIGAHLEIASAAGAGTLITLEVRLDDGGNP